MLNGNRDSTIPAGAVERLFGAAEEPKKMRWYPTGHNLPAQSVTDAADWLAQVLRVPIKPPAPPRGKPLGPDPVANG